MVIYKVGLIRILGRLCFTVPHLLTEIGYELNKSISLLFLLSK